MAINLMRMTDYLGCVYLNEKYFNFSTLISYSLYKF